MNISAATRHFQLKPMVKDLGVLPGGFPAGLFYATAVLVGDWVCISGRYDMPLQTEGRSLTRVFLVNVSTGQAITRQIPGPHAFGQVAVLYDDSIYFYGGYQDVQFAGSKLSRFDFALHEFEPCIVRGEKPENYQYCCSGLVQHSGLWVVFGGSDRRSALRNDLFTLDLRERAWRKPMAKGDAPAPRYAAGHCMDNVESRFYIYSGVGQHGMLNDMFMLHWPKLGRPVWSEVATHPTLSRTVNSHSMTKVGGKLLIYGGEAGHAEPPCLVFETRTRQWFQVTQKDGGDVQDEVKPEEVYTIDGELSRSYAHCAVATHRGILLIGGSAAEWRFIAPRDR